MKKHAISILLIMLLSVSVSYADSLIPHEESLSLSISSSTTWNFVENAPCEQTYRTASESNNGIDDWPDYSYLTEDMLVGSWSPDNQEAQPEIIEFYYDENRELRFYHYRRFGYEYNQGIVDTIFHQAVCLCYPEYRGYVDYSDIYLEFLVSELDKGIIIDRSYGKYYYKISDNRISGVSSDHQEGTGKSWSFDIPDGWCRRGERRPLISHEVWTIYCPEKYQYSSDGYQIETRFVAIEDMDYEYNSTRVADNAEQMIKARYEEVMEENNDDEYSVEQMMYTFSMSTDAGREYYMYIPGGDKPYYYFVPCDGGFLEMHVDYSTEYYAEEMYNAAMYIIDSLAWR